MRRPRALVLLAALATASVGAPRVAASTPSAYLQYKEGTTFGPTIDVMLPEAVAPTRVFLVASGAPSPRFRVRIDRRWSGLGEVVGRVAGVLDVDRVYDVVVETRDAKPYATLSRAFTARAPVVVEMPTTSAAPGEAVFVSMRHVSSDVRFAVNGVPARRTVALSEGVDGFHFGFEMPRVVGVSQATVVATGRGFAVAAPTTLEVRDEPRVLAAVCGGVPVSTTYSTYEIEVARGATYVYGRRGVAGDRGRWVNEEFSLVVPADVSKAALPATFTDADGARVDWLNRRRAGAPLPGPRGVFTSSSCSITVESFDGTRLVGSFSAHVHDLPDRSTMIEIPARGVEFDVADGRFAVEASSIPSDTWRGDPYRPR